MFPYPHIPSQFCYNPGAETTANSRLPPCKRKSPLGVVTNVSEGNQFTGSENTGGGNTNLACGKGATNGAHMQPPSGAAYAERDQLKRKGIRNGLPENRFVDACKSKKDRERTDAKEWLRTAALNDEIPEHVVQDVTQLHPPQSFKKPLCEGPPFYGKQGKAKGKGKHESSTL